MLCEQDCPFYEEHGGEYYQGYWEFYNICWAAPDLGVLPVTCTPECFFIRGDESEMVDVCNKAMSHQKWVSRWNAPPIYRSLTNEERKYIIRDMEAFMKAFTELRTPIPYYK